jgi:hypothetical protein
MIESGLKNSSMKNSKQMSPALSIQTTLEFRAVDLFGKVKENLLFNLILPVHLVSVNTSMRVHESLLAAFRIPVPLGNGTTIQSISADSD